MSAIWYLSPGDTGDELSGTLEREIAPDVWIAEDMTAITAVTLTLYRANNAVYKADLPMTIVGGKVTYAWAAADSQQGILTGKCRATYADGTTASFPKPGRFQIMVS